MLDQNQTNSHTLFVLHEGDSPNTVRRVELLRDAAGERSVPFVAIDSLTCDHTDLPRLDLGDMLFNCGRGSTLLETLLTVPGIATFRSAQPRWIDNGGETVVFSAVCQRMGLPGPKTIYQLPESNDQLWKYVDCLGGFPIVLKPCGGTRGVGVMICSDEPSLLSAVDFLRSLDHSFVLREYIAHDTLLRVLVLGDRVLCTLKMAKRVRDFRSAIDGTYELSTELSEHVAELAIAAAKACEYEFCGIDIIHDPMRGPLLIEINPPSNFASIREQTGIDIAGPAVEHLLGKSKAILAARASKSNAP